MNELARRLLTSETKDLDSAEQVSIATQRICHRFRAHLVRLLGQDGIDALLARSLKVAQRRFPTLKSVRATSDALCMDGLRESLQDQDPAAALDMCVALMESFLNLFASFVGEDLAKQLAQEAFMNPAGAEAADEEASHE